MIFPIITTVIIITYTTTLCIASHYWKKQPERSYNSFRKGQAKDLTLIVACRNIADSSDVWLPKHLVDQTILPQEIILVDDHSTDTTIDLLHTLLCDIPNVRILESPYSQGKKNALRYGVEQAQTPYILCADIDVIPHFNWIAITAKELRQHPADMLILPVYIPDSFLPNLFGEFQALEYAALQTLTAGMAACGHPVMCAGANLAFRRDRWLESLPDIHNEIPSGDDMFMLHSFKRRKLKISLLKSQDASVWIFPSKNLRTLLRQRSRWASKATAYTDFDTLAVGSIMLLTNLWIIVLFFLMILCLLASPGWFDVHYPWSIINMYLFLATLLLKYIIDASFLHRVKNFFELTDVWGCSYLLSFVYPIYVLFTAIYSLFRRKKW